MEFAKLLVGKKERNFVILSYEKKNCLASQVFQVLSIYFNLEFDCLWLPTHIHTTLNLTVLYHYIFKELHGRIIRWHLSPNEVNQAILAWSYCLSIYIDRKLLGRFSLQCNVPNIVTSFVLCFHCVENLTINNCAGGLSMYNFIYGGIFYTCDRRIM